MNSIFDVYNTPLNPLEELAFNIMKSQSPFANDSGYDYDYRGYYKQYGTLMPIDENGNFTDNGHLTDTYKKPNHPTFSIYSKYYTGQPYAVDWEKYPYKQLSEYGIL